MHWKYYIIPRIIRLIKSVFSDLVLVGSQEILKWIWVFFFLGAFSSLCIIQICGDRFFVGIYL
jgi:hypothetical protein